MTAPLGWPVPMIWSVTRRKYAACTVSSVLQNLSLSVSVFPARSAVFERYTVAFSTCSSSLVLTSLLPTMEKSEVAEQAENNNLGDLQKSVTVDTVHNDEAIKVLATYAGDEAWEPREEKKLVRKIDRRLLSILCVTYGLQYYDKAMLSQAVSVMTLRVRDQQLMSTFTGNFWTAHRPGARDRQSIFFLCVNLLSRLHMWSIPCCCYGTTVAD
jgi:hypothetical protein